MKQKIEVIIPNYNGFELIEKNIPKVLHVLAAYPNIEVTIVDDGSRIEEQELLSEYIKSINKKNKIQVKLMLFQKNLGFSSNVNRAALESTSDILVLLNTDVYPRKDFLDAVLPHFKDELLFGVGCMDESIEDKTILRGRGIGEWKSGFILHRKGEVDRTDTFWVSGGSSAFRTDLFKLLGGFDPLYNPFYWEDIDLSYRAQKAGYKILFEPKSVVVHVHKKGSIKKHYKDDTIRSYAMRNQFTIVWKNVTDKDLIFSHLLFLPLHLARAILKRDKIFLKGFFLAILRLPDIMKHRKIQKKQFILKDKDILHLQI
ncbi:MAG TPA: glycosyltransferase family 2 protein [Candidatus Levybacteria bacterium]|nr:glycosyltransferase family 2 protein [Candidatus Levybacteria bacterium]